MSCDIVMPPMGESSEDRLEDRLLAKSSPLVRKLAEAHGIDLRTVRGTGTMGRVTREDLEEHIAQISAGADAQGIAAPAAVVYNPSAPTPVSLPDVAIPSQPINPALESGEQEPMEPLNHGCMSINEHKTAARQNSAHVCTVFEMNMGHISKLLTRHRQSFQETYGIKLSFLPFVMMAVCKALRTFFILKASMDGENITYKQDTHLGIAIPLDSGLIFPVVKHADQLNLGGLSKALEDLTERANSRHLQPEEIQDGTFTITNPGVNGCTFGLPIINPPQVAILGLGALKKRPTVVTDAEGNDSIAIRETMFCTLSFDHRIIDSTTADQFMAAIKHELETSLFGLE